MPYGPYPMRFMVVMVSLMTDQEKTIRSQSLTALAIFMVKVDIFPTTRLRNTMRLRKKAQMQLSLNTHKSNSSNKVCISMSTPQLFTVTLGTEDNKVQYNTVR